MNVTPELVSTVCEILAQETALKPGIDKELRASYPGIPFTVCHDDDIPSRLKPLARGKGFALYGVSVGEHCASLTGSLDCTNGLTIALTDDE
jgi:hypothetical protein